MRRLSFIVSAILVANFGKTQDVSHIETTTNPQLAEGEKKFSEQLLEILEHFKQPDPVGLPGAEVPDPYNVPDMKQSLPIGTLYFKNTAVHGMSKFQILFVDVEIAAMEVNAVMLIDQLQARGNYTIWTWVNEAKGPFTVDITGLKITARASLGVEGDGKLRAQDIIIDVAFKNMAMDFRQLDFFGTMIQGAINSASSFLFDVIKPYILKEAYAKARAEINTKLDQVAGDMQFPNSISPLDMVVADARNKVRDLKYDPYQIEDYNTTEGIFTIYLSHSWIMGLSSFYRVGNISIRMENKTAIADFEIGTQKLEGLTHWDISVVGGLLSRAGTASFSVQYIKGRFILGQPLDTRKRPQFKKLDLEIGNIQVRFDGGGTLDYGIEFAINILPNLLRYQITNALESLVIEKVQQELNTVNVDEMIKEKLPQLDEIQENDFKLSAVLEVTEAVDKSYDEDVFFNF